MLGANRGLNCSFLFSPALTKSVHSIGLLTPPPFHRSRASIPCPCCCIASSRCFCSMYVFLGLERIGGWMCWDVSDPTAPVFQVPLIYNYLLVSAGTIFPRVL